MTYQDKTGRWLTLVAVDAKTAVSRPATDEEIAAAQATPKPAKRETLKLKPKG